MSKQYYPYGECPKGFIKWFLWRFPLKGWFFDRIGHFHFKGNKKYFGWWTAINQTIPILNIRTLWTYRNHRLNGLESFTEQTPQ